MLLALAGVSSAAMAQQKPSRCGTGRHYSGTGQVPSNHKSIFGATGSFLSEAVHR